MPIVIARDGSGEPRMDRPLTQEEKDRLWARIVLSWSESNRDVLRREMEAGNGE